MSTPDELLQWALRYEAMGLAIVPATRGDKKPAVPWEEFQRCRPSRAQIEAWLSTAEYGAYDFDGFGMVTGRVSLNIFLVDADMSPGKQGEETLDDLQMLHGDLPHTWTGRTGGGGKHFFFKAPPGFRVKTGQNVLGPHVDTRGEGGFAMLPPSKHPSGRDYEWVIGCDPNSVEIADAPGWLLELVEDKEPSAANGAGQRSKPNGGSPGGEFDSWGKRTDGREEYMRDLVWARLIEERRNNSEPPTEARLEEMVRDAWAVFQRKCRARGVSLDADGRGEKEMRRKFRRGVKRWDTRIASEASKPKPAGSWEDNARWGETEGSTQSSAPQATRIATVSFYTLLTEDVVEEPDYIEPDFAGPGGFVLIAGPPKAQKSLLVQEMLVSCATGGKFLIDIFNVPKPLKVFYLQAEMNRKLLRKRARIFKFLTTDQRELLKTNFIASERFRMILNEDGVKVAVETIRSAFPNDPPDIIAIDPLANLFDGENESDNTQLMRFLLGRLEVIRQKVNPLACIVLVHHSRKASAEDMGKDPFAAIRGAGSLRGYYDSAIAMFKKSEKGKIRCVHFELRGGESPEPIEVELIDGRFLKALSADGLPPKEVCRAILGKMVEAWRKGLPWSPHPRSADEGRYAVRNMIALFDVTKSSAKFLIEQWQLNGVITFRERERRKHPAGFEVTGSID